MQAMRQSSSRVAADYKPAKPHCAHHSGMSVAADGGEACTLTHAECVLLAVLVLQDSALRACSRWGQWSRMAELRQQLHTASLTNGSIAESAVRWLKALRLADTSKP